MSGSARISVAVPGPWWTLLTYGTPRRCEVGARVLVPVGKTKRVGLVCANGSQAADAYEGELRDIIELIDERPLLTDAAMGVLRWFADTYLCGMGTAMKTLLPNGFERGEAPDTGKNFPGDNPAAAGTASAPSGSRVAFCYEPADEDRFARYKRILSDGAPSLVAFPLRASAKSFFDYLTQSSDFPDELKGQVVLYPHSGPKAEWRAWSRLSRGYARILIGSQSSAMAPLPGLARVIVEDESNHIWRTLRHPVHNVRSLLAKRAKLERADLVLGGRMPSSRAFLGFSETGETLPKEARKIVYVDIRDAYSPQICGIRDSLAVSEPLVRETDAAIGRGAWAVWILDRKGYAGELLCEECGSSVRCAKCGGGMRWETPSRGEARVRCVACGAIGPVPELCPHCRGRLLSAKRPGLDALLPLAKAAIHGPVPILSLEREEDEIPGDALAKRAGLLIGTRAALSLCDKLVVGLIGWLDPDGEARSREYDARFRAFGLIWESCWRGIAPRERVVLLQSRRPGRDWQRGLTEGWRTFWRGEMRERREFGLPPFIPLLAIDASASDAKALCASFDRAGFDYWETDETDEQDEPKAKKRRIWLRTSKMSALRAALEPLFHIGRAKRGYPGVTVWYD